MSTHAPDADPRNRDATDERYAALEVADDAVVIYDRSNEQGWVQSSEAVSLDDAT